MNTVTAPTKRNVSFLLGIGILFLPFVFAWFLLRNGHSLLARILGFGWLILGVLAMAGTPSSTSSHNSNSVASQAAVSSPAAAAPAEPIKAYTASQVASSYEENTVAADMQFKGKRVQVSGRITDINTDFMGKPYLVLAGTNQFMGPQFKFDKSDMSVMATLKKGATVKVICTGKGDVVKTPMFEDCEMSK
ncbi:OB-fold protein [Pseudomonas sp. SDO5591_S426]